MFAQPCIFCGKETDAIVLWRHPDPDDLIPRFAFACREHPLDELNMILMGVLSIKKEEVKPQPAFGFPGTCIVCEKETTSTVSWSEGKLTTQVYACDEHPMALVQDVAKNGRKGLIWDGFNYKRMS